MQWKHSNVQNCHLFFRGGGLEGTTKRIEGKSCTSAFFMTRPSSNSNLITDMMMISNHFLYLLTTLPNTTAYMFPCLLVNTVPITEAKQLEITFPQLKCLAGCSQSESPP